jgi:hypothetical protein
MAGLDPAIYVFLLDTRRKDVDVRDKPGHDEFPVPTLGAMAQDLLTCYAAGGKPALRQPDHPGRRIL